MTTQLKPIHKAVAATVGGGIIAACIQFITPFEGERHTAYQDPVGIWTICMGETKGVTAGMKKTHDECVNDMGKRITDYLGPVDKFMPGLPDNRRIAYTSAAWNLGTAVITRRSFYKTKDGKIHYIPGTSIMELNNSGNWQAACHRLRLFNTAGGKVFAGLEKRRAAEEKLCLGN